MPRSVLPESQIHPAIRPHISRLNATIIGEVQSAMAVNPVVIVGMSGNPHCRRARASLERAGIAYRYLEYGSYLSQWRRRNALKMWTGWPTFPMVFIKGCLIGGASDLQKLIASREIDGLLR